MLQYVIGFLIGIVVSYLFFKIWLKFKLKKLAEEVRRQRERVNFGLLAEKLYPLLSNKIQNAEDLRFIGSPVDYIEFEGLSEDKPIKINFVEIKTGGSKLTEREERVKDAVENKRIYWKEIRIERDQNKY
jgi:predicted Holliday junction resolvase-like endonuclease